MRILTICILAIGLFGCGSDHAKDGKLPDPLVGTWYGTLPCADCEGIRYEVTFSEDGKFVDGMKYLGRSSNVVNASGGYTIQDGIVELDKPTEGYKFLTGHAQGLLMLNKDGDVIEGDLASLYILQKRNEATAEEPRLTPAPENTSANTRATQDQAATAQTESEEAKATRMSRHLKKWENGVNFHAYGNEPYWYLDMKFEESMTFEAMDGLKLTTPMGTPIDVDEGDDQKYRAETESGTLVVELLKEACIDQMSGERFDYTVKVQARNNSDQAYSEFTGCGAYTVDPKLHNIWVIEKHNGQQIDADDFQRGLPQIDINVREGAYSGSDGCNSIRGAIGITRNEVKFASGPTTLMACDDGGKSSAIARDLVSGPFSYSFAERYVELSRDGNAVFLLKNVD